MKRALPVTLTAAGLVFAVAGVFGLAGPWWACLAAALAMFVFEWRVTS